ncbi:MAG: 2-oxoglutarate dehydrogenase E1 component, partial [Bacteroidota bacterium]|nr:2-oxoglutarate dehydrogenase E1 component [Bacteroidota bacterium]MDX5430592.1 2-oxoglutarate dehydrogenase E1 component [Bacteroidota bacterium]MDX5469344.1 2-oxoglutarate dehydrogenase E1 component [Bacteroidota bacterium]
NGSAGQAVSEDAIKEINVLNLIHGYRTRGHLFTRTNPVRERRKYSPTLAIENFGLQASDLEKTFNAGHELGLGAAKLKDIIQLLEDTYCRSIGVEFMYMRSPERLKWLQDKMEQGRNTPQLSMNEKRHFLDKLNKAVVFENFLHTKFVGQKRFSLEGLETLIPALDAVIQFGSEHDVEDFVLGMAHRGRLNVLANILGKSYEDIFKEFEGKAFEEALFEGDVKYHLGYSSKYKSEVGKEVAISLLPNPSHLEAVDPVVQGMARALIDQRHGNNAKKVVPIMIHGDAALAGQGVVYEVVQMALLDAYKVGGTIHIATNNQIGFTTNYTDGRSSTYCTDVAKTTLSPVFHVNADDVEAVIYTVKLAMEYRQTFESDIFIDLLGYRKYGHNEGDEPRFTQPLLYKAIEKHKNPREIYSEQLLSHGKIEADLAREMEKKFRSELQEKLEMAKLDGPKRASNFLGDIWKDYKAVTEKAVESSPKTAISSKDFDRLAARLTELPEGFKPLKKIEKLFKDRAEMVSNDKLDWAMGELMAYASLVDQEYHVRISGQDVERGTFSHRHAIIKSEDSEQEYAAVANIREGQGNFEIYNSLLSEYAVMGFEYGYSLASPKTLGIWEAQFGDFSNGAQIIIDQFLSAAEAKWKTFSGLSLFLPHGYEGQGPEHSSARLERYLQLCAHVNMQVANVTSPANFFHLLRRQMIRDFRIPLVVMTPKSGLRHPMVVSSKAEFTSGGFQEVIDDTFVNAKDVKRVLFCSGKIYFDLLNKQQSEGRKDVAIVRLEQLFPYPEKQIAAIRKKYNKADFGWVQEEPKNMGAWTFLLRWEENFTLKLFSRNSSASPATGFAKVHAKEQEDIVNRAFTLK